MNTDKYLIAAPVATGVAHWSEDEYIYPDPDCPRCHGTGEYERTIWRGPEGMQIEMDVYFVCRCEDY